jgi:small subunit ribosomal protein S4
MARYTGPKTKISRRFGEPITGNGKWLTKNSNPPGQHGATKKRKTFRRICSSVKRKAKSKIHLLVCWKNNSVKHLMKPAAGKVVTGENLIKLLKPV